MSVRYTCSSSYRGLTHASIHTIQAFIRSLGLKIGVIEVAIAAEKEAKAERIEVRVTPNAKALLTAAAQARHTTVSDFLLTHGIEAAEQAVAVPRVFYASEEGWTAIERILDEDDQQKLSDSTISWLKQKRIRD
jgi:uncharacterized protein (DUF1778 family)